MHNAATAGSEGKLLGWGPCARRIRIAYPQYLVAGRWRKKISPSNLFHCAALNADWLLAKLGNKRGLLQLKHRSHKRSQSRLSVWADSFVRYGAQSVRCSRELQGYGG